MSKREKMMNEIRDFLIVTAGSVVYAVGLALFCLCLWVFYRIPLLQQRGNVDEIPVEDLSVNE